MYIVCGPRSGFGPTNVCCREGTNCFSFTFTFTHPSLCQRQHVKTYSGYELVFSCTKVEQNCDMNSSGGGEGDKHVTKETVSKPLLCAQGVCPTTSHPGGRMSTMLCNEVEFASVAKFVLQFCIAFFILHFDFCILQFNK